MTSGNEKHVEDLLSAYAFGVLDANELIQVETHLPVCDECRRLLAEYTETADYLTALAPEATPPDRVWDAIKRETLPSERSASFTRRVAWLPVGAGAAAGLLLGVALGFGLTILQFRSDLRQTEDTIAELESIVQEGRVVSYLAASPDTPVLVLDPLVEGGRSYAMLMGTSSGRFAVLVAGGMDALSEDRVYQLWLTVDGERRDGGIFTVDETGWAQVEVRSDEPMTGLEKVGITVEPSSGSLGPTSDPVFLWTQ